MTEKKDTANKITSDISGARLYIVGIGMGDPRNLTAEAKEAIGSAQLLIGAPRVLAPYRETKRCIEAYKAEEIVRILEQERTREDGAAAAAVLVSGDSGFYSGARKLMEILKEKGHAVTVLPGISSLSYFCARIGMPWEDVKIVSLHGTKENLWQAVLTHEKVFAVTGGGVKEALSELAEKGMGTSVHGYVGERLSYADERIRQGSVQELSAYDYDGLTVLYLVNPHPAGSSLTGLPDTAFVRDAQRQTPMTKAEVRAVVMSKLRIRERDIVYDIGAGTGSVSVETALAASKGTVYAVECDERAIELCKLNKEAFCLHNMEIVEGTAPDALRDLPVPDAAFIGGSKGQLGGIIDSLVRKNPSVRLVIDTVTLENAQRAVDLLENGPFTDVEAVQIQVSRIRKAGQVHMAAAQNPITIVSARGAGAAKTAAKGILIAGAGSGSGKTTIVCGLLKILKDRGYDPCAFKCGPDYIDPSFHQKITGVPCYNLDPFFTDEQTLRQLYERHSAGRGAGVIEGVMGYYDGIGFTGEASTYSVAKALGVPVVLILDCKGMGSSVMAVLEGFLRHRGPSYITGVIFNRLAPQLYEQAAEACRALHVAPLGYLPDLGRPVLESRHLGLVMADEVQGLEEVVGRIADAAARTVDVEGLLRMAGAEKRGCGDADAAARTVDAEGLLRMEGTEQIGCSDADAEKRKGGWAGIDSVYINQSEEPVCCRIAVAQDEAFCFQYEDNLNFLAERGAQIIPFSPLHDKTLPECDALYLSGGYPELYGAGLEENVSMRKAVKDKIEGGMPCIAECGGFLYLHERLEADRENGFYKMTGVIKSDAVNKRRKGRFGYIEAALTKDCLLGQKGDTFRAHEFHYWESLAACADLNVYKPGNGSSWQEGLCTDTLYAGFAHLYFYGSPKIGESFLKAAAEYASVQRNSGGPVSVIK